MIKLSEAYPRTYEELSLQLDIDMVIEGKLFTDYSQVSPTTKQIMAQYLAEEDGYQEIPESIDPTTIKPTQLVIWYNYLLEDLVTEWLEEFNRERFNDEQKRHSNSTRSLRQQRRGSYKDSY